MNSKDELLKELATKVTYFDGELYWSQSPKASIKAGSIAGCVKKGRKYIKHKGVAFFSHRVIYFMHYGTVPKVIDHKDGDPMNNKIENLRSCTPSQNSLNCKMRPNNTSGVRNVNWDKLSKKWLVRIRLNGKRKHIGSFEDFELAELVAQECMAKHYGEWLRA